ncbi:MAG: pyruvate dehydrogenase complex dihydrolipoamide acetyltransferase [Marivita sp.]|uniref:pyruvate dehydrogenase complex dihydrolipoamide acetyltransferase n=1 Tax=Marivita sp. TaxID=2003365 RepID=UPI003EF35550
MPIEILMPALSPTMEDGTLAKWLVKEGDTVSSGDILAEIETDKATMEFEAVDEGVIGKLLISEGTTEVKVNTPIALLLEDGESAEDIGTAQTPVAATPPTPPTPADAPSEAKAQTAPAPMDAAPGTRVFASPLARRIAADKGLDLSQITGTGPRGRIVKADVDGASPQTATTAPSKTAPPASQPADAGAVARIYADRIYTEVPLDGMRKTIAARLTEAKQTIPHFYLRRSVNLDPLLAFRSQLNAQLEKRGVKLSVNDFIIKACALALQQVPTANAVWAGDRILQLTPSDVAVAVAIDGGLFTPVLKDAHQKSLSTLSAEMKDLATRARDRKLAPHEYQGGSFAISNLGMFGIENFDAVINPPHGAILAVGAGMKKPVVGEDGMVSVATLMSMTLSVDHRVIDGALGAELMQAISDNLESPMAMLA